MKLYAMGTSRAHRVRWLLEELGLDYELVELRMTREDLKNDAYLAKNPLGLVPTLEDGDAVVFESGAIVEYLLETYDREHRFLPKPGATERARTRSWLHWAEASASPPLSDYLAHTAVRPEPKRIPEVAEDAKKRLHRVFAAIERELANHDFIAGPQLSAADIMLGFTLHMSRMLSVLSDEHPAALAYYERLAARPAFQRALGN
jgi:glutathione S-transferase